MAEFTNIPNELLFEIIAHIYTDILDSPPNRCRPLPLIHFGAVSRRFRQFVLSYASHLPESRPPDEKYTYIKSQLGPKRFEAWLAMQTPLNVWARNLAEICTFCPNRARHYPEAGSGLKVCAACEAFLLPKISWRRTKEWFGSRPGFEKSLKAECRKEYLALRSPPAYTVTARLNDPGRWLRLSLPGAIPEFNPAKKDNEVVPWFKLAPLLKNFAPGRKMGNRLKRPDYEEFGYFAAADGNPT
jgi:hypothetical protein